MQNDGAERDSEESLDIEEQENAELHREEDGPGMPVESVYEDAAAAATTISITISRCDAFNEPSDLKGDLVKMKNEKADTMAVVTAENPKKGFLQRVESYHEQCRVCHQQTEESLMDIGCQCKGELAKAHRSCIGMWFYTKGSNKCEICQQVAANVPSPESRPNSSNWIWRGNPASVGPNGIQGEHRRWCCNPLWVALLILIAGLLLDVLISIALGVSALPVNIIIGVLILLGLGTLLRLALECCHDWSLRSVVQRVDVNINPGYHPTA